MTLLELLVKKHKEEGWEWPEKAHECYMHEKDAVKAYFYTESGAYAPGSVPLNVQDIEYTGSEHEGFGITREQYEAALAVKVNKSATWDGQGLPPVGVECEMADEHGIFKTVKIIAHESGFVIGWDNERLNTYTSRNKLDFRPIRTEGERKRDEAIEALCQLVEYRHDCGNKPIAGWIYAAIAAGKIPGVRLTD